MYSFLNAFLNGTDIKFSFLENIRITLYFFIIIACATLVFKNVIKRNYYLNAFPSKKFRSLSLFGSIADFLKNGKIHGITPTIYMLQIFMGYNEIFKNKSFFFFSLSYIPCIVITKAEGVEEVIAGSKNMEKNFAYDFVKPWLGTGLLLSHGSKWKSRRKLLTPSFHFEILKDFLPVFNYQSAVLIKILQKETNQPWTDIVKPITLCSLDIICETTLGVRIEAQNHSESEYVRAVSRASDVIMKRQVYPPYFADWYFFLSSMGHQFKKDLKLLHNFTREVISDKKQKFLKERDENKEIGKRKRKALLDLLLEQHLQNKSLSEEDIREEVDTFAFAGHDTTSMGMSWALYMIGLHPNVQDNLHEEIDRIFGDDYERPVRMDDLTDLGYLDRVLKETQRLYPSVPIVGRKLSEDMDICGTRVPKDINIVILTYALHRDAAVFPNPEKFDPDRFLTENTAKRHPFAYIPFSAGPRNCIGQRFALMEEKVVLTNILRHYSVESLDARDKVIVTPDVVLRPASPLRIKLRPRRL